MNSLPLPPTPASAGTFSTAHSLGTASQNISASQNTIYDTDLSPEILDFTKNQILEQVNFAPQAILKLLS